MKSSTFKIKPCFAISIPQLSCQNRLTSDMASISLRKFFGNQTLYLVELEGLKVKTKSLLTLQDNWSSGTMSSATILLTR